mgnify:CR=1 FL=1
MYQFKKCPVEFSVNNIAVRGSYPKFELWNSKKAALNLEPLSGKSNKSLHLILLCVVYRRNCQIIPKHVVRYTTVFVWQLVKDTQYLKQVPGLLSQFSSILMMNLICVCCQWFKSEAHLLGFSSNFPLLKWYPYMYKCAKAEGWQLSKLVEFVSLS